MGDHITVNASLQLIGNSGRTFIQRFASFTGQDLNFLTNSVERYNRDFSAYGNEVYSQLETRVAHWANFLDQGWFERRMDFPLLAASQYDAIVDLGFSVPYAFALPHLRDRESCKFIFVDRESSTLEFYNILTTMESWGSVSNRAQVMIADIEQEQGLQKVSNAIQEMQPKSVLIIASEVLEHLHDSEPVMQWVVNMLRQKSHSRCTLYLTLPIGLKIPSHTVEFLDAKHANEWIDRYLPFHNAFVLAPSVPQPLRPQSAYSIYCAWAETYLGRLFA